MSSREASLHFVCRANLLLRIALDHCPPRVTDVAPTITGGQIVRARRAAPASPQQNARVQASTVVRLGYFQSSFPAP